MLFLTVELSIIYAKIQITLYSFTVILIEFLSAKTNCHDTKEVISLFFSSFFNIDTRVSKASSSPVGMNIYQQFIYSLLRLI